MNTMLAWSLGGWEVVLIVLAVLVIFGGKKLPELARGLGQSIREFKKGAREVTDEIQNAANETPAPPNKTVKNGQSQPGQAASQPSNPPKV